MEHRDDGEAAQANPGSAAPRKPYAPPRLRVYGNVAALTRTIGNMSMKADGGGGMNSKTG
jgi:hypothetical protein